MSCPQHLKDTIMQQYPGVWDVRTSDDDDEVAVVVTATPLTHLCLVALSRMVAGWRPTCYTIDVRYNWNPCRFQKLFAPDE